MKIQQVNLAIVGCGWIADRHIEAYQWMWENNLRYFNIVAICDLMEDAANLRAERIGEFQGARPQVYTNLEVMLSQTTEIDAVDVCTHRHDIIAIPSLEANKNVTIEKPFGFTIKECQNVMNAVKPGKVLSIAEGMRREPKARTAKWCIDKGMIGKPRMLFWSEISWWTHYRDWRHHKLQAGGGGVLDVGVHFVNLWRYLLGEAEEVFAMTRAFEPYKYFEPPHRPYNYPYTKIYKETKVEEPIGKIEVDVEDTALSLIKFENDVLLEWTLTSAAPRKEFSHQILYGSEGCIDYGAGKVYSEGKEYELAQLQEEMMSSLDEETKERFFPNGSTSQFVIELADFAQAVLKKRKPEIDGMEGMKDVAVCMAVYESSALNQLVKLSEIESRKIENYQREINEALGI